MREVVQTAAVLGREFEVQVLAQHVAGRGRARAEVALAEEAAIWSALSELRYLFKHVLLRDAAYDMQVRARRAELHQLAAEALETLYADDPAGPLQRDRLSLTRRLRFRDLSELAAQARRYLTQAGEQANEQVRERLPPSTTSPAPWR